MNFEKWALTILGTVITTMMLWVMNGVQDSQVQYSAIQERLLSNSTILLKLQNTVEKSTSGRIALERSDAIQSQRILDIDKDISEIKAIINNHKFKGKS